MHHQRRAAMVGIVGCLVLLVVVGTTIAGYVGRQGEPYAMINHFVSELGRVGVSRFASIFNDGLLVSGALFGFFGVGVTKLFLGWRRVIVGLLAFATFASVCLIGLYPVNKLSIHLAIAYVFFPSALALALFLSCVTVFSNQPVLPKWTAISGFLTTTAFTALVVSPTDSLKAWLAGRMARPAVWPLCILEWACFFTIVFWIVSIAIAMTNAVPLKEPNLTDPTSWPRLSEEPGQ